jgi:hypothetical protein
MGNGRAFIYALLVIGLVMALLWLTTPSTL